MISQTLTQVETHANNFQILLKPLSSFSNTDASVALASLTIILETYALWEDPLSQHLFKWGVKVLEMANPEGEKLTLQQAQEKFQKKIQHLFQKILVNPLDDSPNSPRLEHPVLERDWVWEKAFLESYLTLNNLSPFDGKPMEEMRPHLFAEEMIKWTKSHLFTQIPPILA